MKLRIGNTVLENNVILAPMAGVTDLPFRVLCREQGAGCVVTEMVSAKAVLYNNRNTRELLQIDPAERPAAVQLFGSDPDIMAEIAARLEEGPYDYIDVNMGCPVPKIVNNGEGSALMKNPGTGEGSADRHGESGEKARDGEIPQGVQRPLCQCGGIC